MKQCRYADVGEQLSFDGQYLPKLTPSGLKAVLSAPKDLQAKLQALRDQTAQLNKQLDEVKNATESTWDSVKGGFKKAYEASKEGFQQARQWVSDKIAP